MIINSESLSSAVFDQVTPASLLTCHTYSTGVDPIPLAVDMILKSCPSTTERSPGQDMAVIADPLSWKSFTPLLSWSRPVVDVAPLTDPLAFIVGLASPNIPSSLGSLSVPVP